MWSATSNSWKPLESFCEQFLHMANSGIKIFRIPVFSRSLRLSDGLSQSNILQNSSLNLSTEIEAVFFNTSGSERAARVFSSILNPSWPENLTARTGLSPSSANRSCGSPTVRIILFLMSFCPSKGSVSSPLSKSAAIAFIVKSRRERSSSIVVANFMLSGCLPSV